MLITTKEVAALLRVHPKHVYRLLKRGLPAHRVGDEWRYDEAEVLRWARLARGDEGPSPGAHGDPRPDAALRKFFKRVKAALHAWMESTDVLLNAVGGR